MTKSEEKARYLLPVGVSDYRILVTHRNSNNIGYLFVDKSLFGYLPKRAERVRIKMSE